MIQSLQEYSEDESDDYWQRDVTILSSIPGIGRKILATLLAEASDAWLRRDLQALRRFNGTKYKASREKVHAHDAHARALCGVGDRLQGVAVTILENQTEFDRNLTPLQKQRESHFEVANQ